MKSELILEMYKKYLSMEDGVAKTDLGYTILLALTPKEVVYARIMKSQERSRKRLNDLMAISAPRNNEQLEGYKLNLKES